MKIIILIDYNITESHLEFIKELINNNNNKNIYLYTNNENYGIAKTKNICIKLLEEQNIKYICLLDDDIEILKDFSQYVINIFENNNELKHQLLENQIEKEDMELDYLSREKNNQFYKDAFEDLNLQID